MQKHSMSALWASSALAGGNIHYLEYLYELYLQDPTLVSENWQQYFSSLPMVEGKNGKDVSHAEVCQQFIDLAKMPVSMRTQQQGNGHQHQSVSVEHEYKQIQVLRLINAYRLQGHLHAQIDPLSLREVPKECITELTLEDHGLSIEDMSTSFDSETFVGPKQMTLGELYRALNDAYCGSIGTEYMHLCDL